MVNVNKTKESIQNVLIFITDAIALIMSYYMSGFIWLMEIRNNTFSYVIVMTILSCFNVMGQPMVLTPGTASTEVVIQNIYNTAFGANKYGRASTMSLILAAIMGVFSLLSLKVALNKGGSNNEKH